MTTKIVQVEILAEEQSPKLEASVNKFLIDKRINPENIIDIKLDCSGNYRRAMIIYSIVYEETK